MLDLEAARARCEAATKGKWKLVRSPHSDRTVISSNSGNVIGAIMGINDAEFIVHARSDLPAALEALEEAELRGVTFEQWFRAAVKHHNDLTTERDGYKAQAEVRGEALDKMGCSYNLRYPCITALKDYPSSWCQRCIALAATPGRTREEEKERR